VKQHTAFQHGTYPGTERALIVSSLLFLISVFAQPGIISDPLLQPGPLALC